MSHMEEENDDKTDIILIATMYNIYCNKNQESNDSFNILYLKPIYLSISDFFSLFYSTGSKKFCINKTHKKNESIMLSKQIVSSDDTYFSIREMLDIFEIVVIDMNSSVIFELQKEVKAIDSLANITGTCSSLSWEQLSSLVEYKYNNRKVDDMFIFFQIKLVYWSNVLQRDFTIVFQYNVCVEEIIQYIGSESDSLTRYKNNYNERRKEKTANELKLSKREVMVERSRPIDNITNTSTNVGKNNMFSIKNRPPVISEKPRVNKQPEVVQRINLNLNTYESNINLIDELTKLNKSPLPINTNFSIRPRFKLQMPGQPQPQLQQPQPQI